MTRREQVAWAAGFIDGEGYIGLHRGSVESGQGWKSMTLSVRVSQKRRKPLDVLAALFGGNVRTTRRCYEWVISASKAAAALKEMLPFLVLKLDQAELAVEYQEVVSRHRGSARLTDQDRMVREFVFTELKALKVGT